MKIAIVGWGSLIKKLDGLPILGDWQTGGPILQIEFSRISNNGRITLVIDEINGAKVGAFYAISFREDLEEAITDLKKREGTPNRNRIGFCNITDGSSNQWADKQHHQSCEVIRAWGAKNKFDAVIWTALTSNFQDKCKESFSVDGALSYLENLEPSKKQIAIEYIRDAPPEVLTPFRREFTRRYHGAP